MDIKEKLFELKDESIQSFSASLTPNIESSRIIGVRVPLLRALAKGVDEETAKVFLEEKDHHYMEEKMIHRYLIENIKDYNTMILYLEKFLPMIDCWIVCDGFKSKAIKKHLDEFIVLVKKWLKSRHVYTRRFALGMLMAYYLDDAFKEEYLELAARVPTDGEYYLIMMKGWYFATALAKQWDSSIKIIENRVLDVESHNKAIRKSIESFRISDEHKDYLRTLKR